MIPQDGELYGEAELTRAAQECAPEKPPVNAHNSSSSTRFTEASVRNPMLARVRLRQATISRSKARVRFLSPMKLSSTPSANPRP